MLSISVRNYLRSASSQEAIFEGFSGSPLSLIPVGHKRALRTSLARHSGSGWLLHTAQTRIMWITPIEQLPRYLSPQVWTCAETLLKCFQQATLVHNLEIQFLWRYGSSTKWSLTIRGKQIRRDRKTPCIPVAWQCSGNAGRRKEKRKKSSERPFFSLSQKQIILILLRIS